MFVLETVVLLILTAPFLWWYMFVVHKYKSLKNIPGPKPLPFVGNATDVGSTPQDFYKNLKKLHQTYGDVFKIFIGSDVRVFISKPELLEKLLSSNTHITKSDGYDILTDWLREGILTSTGPKWKGRRRMITTTFHFKILEQFMDVFNSCSNILVKKLSQEAGKDSVDIYPFINLCAFDIVCQTSMGMKYSLQEDNDKEYVETVRGFIHIAMERFFSPWEKNNWLFQVFSKKAKLHNAFLRTLDKFANKTIEERRKEKLNQKSDISVSDDGIRKKVALLDMLLEAQKTHNLTNEDIKEEINTILFAGHDTTSSGISFALFNLAHNPDIQEKLYDEIITVLGDEDHITMQHLHDMKYLEMVVKESQRFHPTVPFVERRLEENWSVDGYDFPKDTFLTIFMYGVHQNNNLYPNPEIFDPERFSPENQSKRHAYAYIPFSAGPRNCIGQRFAMLGMKTVIVKVLKEFRLTPVPNFKPELGMSAILKSYNGIHVGLQRR